MPKWVGALAVTAVALLLLGYFIQTELSLTNGELSVPLDDAWIHYQFARNLSRGEGFSYNPGEPTPGSTAPLWTLLLAGVGLFTEDFLVPSLLLSAFFFLLTIWLTHGFVYSLTKSKLAALLTALGVALAGRLLWAGLAGMETTAFAALSVAAVWAYTKWGLRPFPAFLFALAGQLRPEGHALFALAVVDSLWTGWVVERRSLTAFIKPLAGAGLIYGLIAAPYVIFSLATTGHPLPNTFYAKVGSEHFFSWRTLRETAAFHWRDNPISLLLLPFGAAHLRRRGRLALVWLLTLPLLTAVIIDQTWHHGRYTIPLIPFQMIAAGLGAFHISRMLRELEFPQLPPRKGSGIPIPEPSPTFKYARAGLSVLLVLAVAWGGGRSLSDWARQYGLNGREILEIDVALGHWLAENTPPDALLAVDDIGAIAFLSERRIVDLNGLVSPEMWPATRQSVGLPRDRALTRILSAAQPDYVVAFALWHWELTHTTAVAHPIHQVKTESNTIIFQPEAAVYETTWPYAANIQPQRSSNIILGDAIELVGFDWADDNLDLTLYWRSLTSIVADYDIFIHVLSGDEIVVQIDQKPVQGLAPTQAWQPGDLIRDPYRLPLPPDLPAGAYDVKAGMYLRETGARLPVYESADNAILLTTFDYSP
ncbi:MAG: hypothetical protein GY803_08560 [Chloroflexi bacterium]|nr:hypothetical protein [Chloroflexota bacterium]